MRLNKAIVASLALALACLGSAQVDPQRVVATVNGTEIKGAEYYHRMEFLPGVGKNMGDGFAEFPPGFLTLEQLITEKLIFQLAREKGVSPSEPEIQAELDYRKVKNKNLVTDWLASGRTMAELMYAIKFDLAQFKILTAGITVTDQEVEDFYKKNKAMYTTPEQVTLRVIVVRTQADADLVDRDLASGKSFADTAKAHSADVTAQMGGEYGTVPITMLSDNVRTALKPLTAGQSTAWFTANKDPNSSAEAAKFKFLLEKRAPEQLQVLDGDLRRQTRQRIMMDSGKVKNDIKKELNALRAKANIEIKEKSFADAYEKFKDASLKSAGIK